MVNLISKSGMTKFDVVACTRVVFLSILQAREVVSKYKIVGNIYINKDLTKIRQSKTYTISQKFKTRQLVVRLIWSLDISTIFLVLSPQKNKPKPNIVAHQNS